MREYTFHSGHAILVIEAECLPDALRLFLALVTDASYWTSPDLPKGMNVDTFMDLARQMFAPA